MQAAGITEIKADDGTFKASFRKSRSRRDLRRSTNPRRIYAWSTVKTERTKPPSEKRLKAVGK
ncbi:hypothetical protein [Neisseria gonorrhoeae]|uniref:hypothetical protein n=1 Tax=Neisseria gonorrhoeae TaxID=485 RepID=UPI00223F08FC|nr:hypothetical protein [Neisseria gonorrhoeae]UYP53030.1 hypothetical protein ND436_002860 [Neisseria gonorrhoeae]